MTDQPTTEDRPSLGHQDSQDERLTALEAEIVRLTAIEADVFNLSSVVKHMAERLDALEAKPKGRGSRLSEDWMPNPAERDFSVKIGLTGDDIVKAILSFKAYWVDKTGPNSTKLSWSRTWQEWCRKDADRLGREPRTATLDTGSPDDSPVPTSQHTEAARQALEDVLPEPDELERHRLARLIRDAYARPRGDGRDVKISTQDRSILEACGKTKSPFLASREPASQSRLIENTRRVIENRAKSIGIQPHQFSWPEVK